MIDTRTSYPAMKDSDVPWLGEVPEHWDVSPIARIGPLFKGNGGSKEDEVAEGVPCVRYGDLYTRHEFFITSTKACVSTERAPAYTVIRPGDVLFAASGETIEDIGRSAVNLLDVPACCGGDVLLLRPSVPANPGFLGYAADASPARRQKATMGRGFTVVHIYASQLKRLTLALPPLAEQAAIVRFLDHADRRIRRYIRAKQKLIKLLEEQKQAIIHQAVTGRIDVRTGQPYPAYKNSGVEWLGEVPEHWEVWQVGHFARVGNGSTPSRGNPAYWTGGTFPWLNSSSVNAAVITAASQFVTETALRECHLPRVPPGSVLVAITGQGKTRGTAAVLKIEATINQHIAFITPRKATNAEYLQAVLVAAYSELRRMSDDSGSTKGALTCEDLRHFRVALPPLKEQQRILESVKDSVAEVDAASETTKREIALLHEYRTRLIADVVTGKLDVREAAARLPDERDEPLPDAAEDESAPDEPADDLDAMPEEAEA